MAIFWLFSLEIASDMARHRPYRLATLPGCAEGSKELIWIPHSTQVCHKNHIFRIFMPKIALNRHSAILCTAGQHYIFRKTFCEEQQALERKTAEEIEAEKRRTMDYQANLDRETAKVRAEAETEGIICCR